MSQDGSKTYGSGHQAGIEETLSSPYLGSVLVQQVHPIQLMQRTDSNLS